MTDEMILVVRRSLLEQLGAFQGLSFDVLRNGLRSGIFHPFSRSVARFRRLKKSSFFKTLHHMLQANG